MAGRRYPPPRQVAALQPILLWHDQGLLQGLATVAEQAAYRRLLDHMVLPGGWVILAAQAPPAGETLAPGKQVTYDVGQLAALLGPEYSLQQHFQQPYSRCGEPASAYTYALFQRNAQVGASFRKRSLLRIRGSCYTKIRARYLLNS